MSGSDAIARRPSYEELEALVVSQAAVIPRLDAEVAELRAAVWRELAPLVAAAILGRVRQAQRGPQEAQSAALVGPAAWRPGRARWARLEPVQAPDEQVEHPPERCETNVRIAIKEEGNHGVCVCGCR